MDRDAYQLMAAAERDHWWFRGRRVFIERAMRTLALPASARILDAGCGSGGNLALLSQFGTVYGFEYDAEARAVAEALGVAIGLFDVLEHLPHPVESLQALAARLAPGGAIVLTVPALPWLWGPHDEVHNHFRRYTATTLQAHLAAAGLRVERLTYMNALLLPLAVAQRLKERLFGYQVEALTPSPMVNRLLYRTWLLERAWIPQRRLPIGLSLLAVARRAEPAG
jgi:2-polyprenyl-3-methyl-5-hydroxy-6-metoxy-1,4-benzoquinol methylase